MAALRAKSVQQTEYFIALWKRCWRRWAYTLKSPRQAPQRGSHISLGHTEGWRINQALMAISMYCPIFVRRTTSAWALRRSTQASLTSIRQRERLRRWSTSGYTSSTRRAAGSDVRGRGNERVVLVLPVELAYNT
jgi:hypothetical protein